MMDNGKRLSGKIYFPPSQPLPSRNKLTASAENSIAVAAKRNSESKPSKRTFKEKLKNSFFTPNENIKLVKLNRAVSDGSPHSPVRFAREFPSFNFSPDEISNSEFGNNSEYESEFHYLEEFRKELDEEYKPAFLCDPKVSLTMFNYNDISEFAQSITAGEWRAYRKWRKMVFQRPMEREEFSKKVSVRMRIFLHFYRLEIPIAKITENNIKTLSDWKLEGYEVMECASFLQIPLNENYSPNWWCCDAPVPPSSCLYGFSNVCHYYQTKIDSNLTNTRMKYKKIKEELRKYILEFESIASIMTSDPFTQNIYVKLLIRWAISSKSKIPHKLRINSCIVLSRLAFPVETIVGLREKILQSGVVFVILTYARRGDLNVAPNVELAQIQIDHFLDSGAVGRVHLGKWKEEDVAIKMCQGSSAAFVISEFRFEVALMTMLSHPNILKCLSAKVTDPSPYFLVSPYQTKGSLRSVLMDQYEEVSDRNKVWAAYCIASAGKYLHKYKIIHRDIKSCNVLVGEDWKSICLTDFGTSRFLGRFDSSPLESFVGTNEYMAPEVLHQAEDEKVGLLYDFKVDVYSYAIVLFELITRSVPYEGVKSFLIPDLVLKGERPSPPNSKSFSDYKPKELVELMKICWSDNPKRRPSFADIKQKLKQLLRKYDKLEMVKNHLLNSPSKKPKRRSHHHTPNIILRKLERKKSAPNAVGANVEKNEEEQRDRDTIIQTKKINYRLNEHTEKKRKEIAIKNLLNKHKRDENRKDVNSSNAKAQVENIGTDLNHLHYHHPYTNDDFTPRKFPLKKASSFVDHSIDSIDVYSDFNDDFAKQVQDIEEQFKSKSEMLEQDLDDIPSDDDNAFDQPAQTMGLGFSLDDHL